MWHPDWLQAAAQSVISVLRPQRLSTAIEIHGDFHEGTEADEQSLYAVRVQRLRSRAGPAQSRLTDPAPALSLIPHDEVLLRD